jgi:hypothetical protein
MPDPDVTAVLLTIAIAGSLSLPRAVSNLRKRRNLKRVCAFCGRLLILGEKTCDCALRGPR